MVKTVERKSELSDEWKERPSQRTAKKSSGLHPADSVKSTGRAPRNRELASDNVLDRSKQPTKSSPMDAVRNAG
jgi:hypothetical protein